MASELESNLRDTVDWCRKWLVDFNFEKTQLLSFDCMLKHTVKCTVQISTQNTVVLGSSPVAVLSFDRSNNSGAIDVKMGSVPEEKSSFMMLGLTFSSKPD